MKVFKNNPLAPQLQFHPKTPFGRHGVHSQLMEVGSAALKSEKPGVIHTPEEVARSLNRHQRLLLKAILHHDGKYKADKVLKAFMFRISFTRYFSED